MGLVRVNTAYFEVVNTSDPDVVADGEASENEWLPRSACTVGPAATIVRIRALSRREFDAVPLSDDGKMLGALVDADLAKESATLTSLQVRQQLGIQAVGIANQAPQNLLGLFR